MSVLDKGYGDYSGNQPKGTRLLTDWHDQVAVPLAIDPEVPIVDAHHHLFGSSDDTHFYRLEQICRDINSGHQILGTVYVEAYDSGWHEVGPVEMRPVGEVESIANLTAQPITTGLGDCRIAAGIVGFADLSLGDMVETVIEAEIAAGQGRLRGIRNRSAWDGGLVGQVAKTQRSRDLLLQPNFRRGYAVLEKHGLSFDAWVYHTQIPDLVSLADQMPGTTLIVNHLAGPIGVAEYRGHHEEVMREWKIGLEILAERSNVVVKLGGMGMPVFGFGFENQPRPADAQMLAAAWKPYVETCIAIFGTSRCLFESNAPVDMQSGSYCEIWNAFKLLTRDWSSGERSDLFYRTACRTYRLPELEALGDHRMGLVSSPALVRVFSGADSEMG